MSGYMGSYYESYILEIMTGIESVSTAQIVYVYYSKPVNKPANGHSFFTCPHARRR